MKKRNKEKRKEKEKKKIEYTSNLKLCWRESWEFFLFCIMQINFTFSLSYKSFSVYFVFDIIFEVYEVWDGFLTFAFKYILFAEINT